MAARKRPVERMSASSATPRVVRRPSFLTLRDLIAADIARNVWGPGEAISTESELAAQHDLSLGTVRRALDLLESEGMVERIRGSGTFVRRPDFETAFVRFIRYYGSAGDRRTPHSVILEREALIGPPDVTSALQLLSGTRVIRLLRQR
ncbi:MAG: GntR family transcriptional regulator, partial [Pseudonocardiales bacterium]|nr:GntR family transcriptional regulator [Pseudonocardiales bacterium]